MAKSAVTSYSSLLKEIADGLTEQDVGDIKLLLRYPAAVKISTGTQLLVEMQRQDDLDEDNLVTLKDALGKQKLKRLVKIVEKFEQASSDTSQGEFFIHAFFFYEGRKLMALLFAESALATIILRLQAKNVYMEYASAQVNISC